MPVRYFLWMVLTSGVVFAKWFDVAQTASPVHQPVLSPNASSTSLDCNCTITQSGISYPVSALLGNQSASALYSYGVPVGTSANTGLELSNGLILFLYEDITTSITSLFLIADVPNSGSGGSLEFEVNCLPPEAYVSVEDDAGEFFGSPPTITGDWVWLGCCTDGGVIEQVGCTNSFTLDLLISSGIDSVVWLTGDIADPDHILLSMSGEIITINCGGGVCCPLEFDTEISVVNSTCPDSPNGSISVTPEDGVPPFSYDWSNGESGNTITDLLPGNYTVTITDAQGCTEELQMTVDVSPGDPPAQSASMELCSSLPQDLFDLTSVEDIINLNTGFNVLWYTDPNLTNIISNPAAFLSGTTTVYAVVDNGSCLSDPVPVDLILLQAPAANMASMSLCEEGNGMATFDLTTLDNAISGGAGNVLWYLDPGLNTPVPDPSAFYTTSITVYAVVDDGTCMSLPAEVELTVYLKPLGDPASMSLCGDENNEAVFDLTLLEPDVSGGNGSVEWFLEIELSDPITNITDFLTTTITVYAVVFDGLCHSDPVAVDLIVETSPTANPITIGACDEGSGMAWFDLTAYATQVSGGIGGVEWYFDEILSEPIPNPGAFLTEPTIIWAVVDNGICYSDPVQIELAVLMVPEGHPTFMETCADSTGQGLFDLTAVETIVSGGTGMIQWFEDASGNFNITMPSAFLSAGGVVYARIHDGPCVSELIPVNLVIVSSVTASPTTYSLCDDGTGEVLFDLTGVEGVVSNGTGQVVWYKDMSGTQLITTPDSFPCSGDTVYARVIAGDCASDIVPVELLVLPSPVATGTTQYFCGNVLGEDTIDLTAYDTLINGNMGNVSWYGDSLLINTISNPTTFVAGDTLLYATVTNGICTSSPVTVMLVVSTALTAEPFQLDFCLPPGDTLLFDLTLYDTAVSGGIHQVHWYADSTGAIEILNPESLPISTSMTVFANVSDANCVSALVPVQLSVLSTPVANAITILECGDANGEYTFNLLTADVLVSENTGTVTWYGDAALSVAIPTPGSFHTADTLIYAIVTNGFCVSNAVAITLDVTDSIIATPITVQLCVAGADTAILDLTQSDLAISGGTGMVTWFTDSLGLDPVANPAAFVTAGDTLYARVISGGCVSNTAIIPVLIMGAYPPEPACAFSSADSLVITWLPVAGAYTLTFTINGQPAGNPVHTVLNTFHLGGLGYGDTLVLAVAALFDSICTVPLMDTVTCITEACPPQVTITIEDPGSVCSNDDPFLLNMTIEGLSGTPDMKWLGQGIADPAGLFDPALALPGENMVMVTVTEGSCVYEASAIIFVQEQPTAAFDITGVPCVDSALQVIITGMASDDAEWIWDFAGADTTMTSSPPGYEVHWNQAGNYSIQLVITDHGCLSEAVMVPVQIDGPLASPVLECLDEDFNAVSVTWEPVPGALGYTVTSSLGVGVVSGQTCTFSSLPDDTAVEITVMASGATACGPSIATVICTTQAYIPVNIYVPNVFSPNDDGINDRFYLHTNDEVTQVKVMRIFDRWGNMVFEKINFPPNDPQFGWDGSFLEKPMNPGVYTYWVLVQTARNDEMTLAGDVTVVR